MRGTPTDDGLITTPLVYYLGTDWGYEFTVYTSNARTTCRDVTGYTTNFIIKRSLSDVDASALLSLDGTVTGTFNSDPHANTQRVVVLIADTDTDTEITPGVAYWELKRTDDGSEEVLGRGEISLRRAAHIS